MLSDPKNKENILQGTPSLRPTSSFWAGLFTTACLLSPSAIVHAQPNTTAPQATVATSRPTSKPHSRPSTKAPPRHTFTNHHRGGYPFLQSVAFSSDGRRILAGAAGRYGGIRMWDWWSGIEYDMVKTYGDIVRVSFLQKDRKIGFFRVYTPGDSVNGDGFFIHDLGSPKASIWSTWLDYAVFSPSTSQGTIFQKSGKLLFYNEKMLPTPLSKEIKKQGLTGIALAPKSRYAALVRNLYEKKNKGATASQITLVDLHKNKAIKTLRRQATHTARRMALTSDGERLVIGRYGKVEIWAPKQQKHIRDFDFPNDTEILPLFSPDEKTLIMVTQPSIGRSWSYAKTRSGFRFRNKHNSLDTKVFFYDARTLKQQKSWTLKKCFFRTTYYRFGSMRGAEHNPERAAFSPSGHILAVACSGGLQILNIRTNKRIKTIPWLVRGISLKKK
ncbi:MAG: WD40 repeat domain-containing protein [Myxococcales bacterium]|nr:WD40 repeat domain-containing protein [Myxococcales bacterium]